MTIDELKKTPLDELMHYGVLGMKWGVRKDQEVRSSTGYSPNEIKIAKNSEIHRMVPKSWADKEREYGGHAYASFLKEDVDHYRKISELFGKNSYVDLSFKTKEVLISPSEKRRVDAFVELMKNDTEFNKSFTKATRNIIVFTPKSDIKKVGLNDKSTNKAYDNFAYLLVSKSELRDPYISKLQKEGYSMVVDDADRKAKLAASPIIIFDRKNSLELQS